MRYSFFILLCALILAGCNSKKYYEPKAIEGQIILQQNFKTPIEQNNRYTAVLKDGSLLTQTGFIPYSDIIPKKSTFLNESGGYYIFAKGCESLVLIKTSKLDEKAFDSGVCAIKEQNKVCTQEIIEIPSNTCIIAASLKADLLATISTDNTASIIQIPSNETKFSQKGSPVIAVNHLIAAPLFLDSNVVFPTLDGRLLVVNIQSFETQRNIIITSDKYFKNIIYLQGDDTRIFAATPKKIISIISGQEFSYNDEIKDVLLDGKYLYALTLEGKVAQLDHTLREVNTLKFPFAALEGMIIVNNNFYTFEKKGGFVIAIHLNDFSYKVYQTQDSFGKLINNKLDFYTKNIFYYNK